jgi:hypothetical protein
MPGDRVPTMLAVGFPNRLALETAVPEAVVSSDPFPGNGDS